MRTNDLRLSPESIRRNLATLPPPVAVPKSFYFPPSPPYTNPSLKLSVPLPCPVDCGWCPTPYTQKVDASSLRDMPLIEEEDYGYSASTPFDGSFELITPPSSPRRGNTLCLEDEQSSLDPAFPPILDRSFSEESSQEWSRSIEEAGSPDSEDDDWDDPLFLNAPTADCDLESPHFANIPASGAIEHEHWLSKQESHPPLDAISDDSPSLHPSFFDVFKNDWDTIPVQQPQSMLINVPSIDSSGSPHFSTHSSVQSCINPLEHSLFNEQTSISSGPYPSHSSAHRESNPYGLVSPPSPSRRSTLSLPSNNGGITSERQVDHGTLNWSASPFLQDFSIPNSSSLLQLTYPHHMLSDVPSDIFQSSFNIPLHLPQVKSLLFVANPEDIPLPPSPVLDISDLSSSDSDSDDVPLALLEESRLRSLKQRYIAKEQCAKARDVALLDFIARWSSMREPEPDTVYCAVPGGHIPMLLPPSSNGDAVVLGSPYMTFQQVRAFEIQEANVQRNIERAKRKRAKERIREITALLVLKSAHIRATDRVPVSPLSPPTSLPPIDDEIPQSFASVPAHEVSQNGETDQVGHDLLHLVAKMFFKRRDSPRSLGGRLSPSSPPRRYVRSSLSKETLMEDGVKYTKGCDCCIAN